jgi:hypothetical protein
MQTTMADSFAWLDPCTPVELKTNYTEWECYFRADHVPDNTEFAVYVYEADGQGLCPPAVAFCILDSHYVASTARTAAAPVAYFVRTPTNSDVDVGLAAERRTQRTPTRFHSRTACTAVSRTSSATRLSPVPVMVSRPSNRAQTLSARWRVARSPRRRTSTATLIPTGVRASHRVTVRRSHQALGLPITRSISGQRGRARGPDGDVLPRRGARPCRGGARLRG